jgi:hypothetical protein
MTLKGGRKERRTEMFEKVQKQHCGGSRVEMTEQISIGSSGRIGIPRGEMKYLDSYNPGGGEVTNVVLEIDTSDVNHKVRLTPSSNKREYTLGRKDGAGQMSSKALVHKNVQTGIYVRVDKCTYEHAGMEG